MYWSLRIQTMLMLIQLQQPRDNFKSTRRPFYLRKICTYTNRCILMRTYVFIVKISHTCPFFQLTLTGKPAM